MMNVPAHKSGTAGQVRHHVTLADYINQVDPLTGDLRKPPPVSHAEALRTLMVAADNYERAVNRVKLDTCSAAGANLRGATLRLSEARAIAADSLQRVN